MEPKGIPSAREPGARRRRRRLLVLASLGVAAGGASLGTAFPPDSVAAPESSPGCFQDDDCDGLPNLIEVQFGSLSSSIDSDGDGCVDFEEWILRTDPIARPAPAPAYAARVFSYLIPSSPEPLVRIGIAACAPNNDLAWLNQTQLVVLLGNQMGGALVDMRDLAFGDPDGIEITPGSLPGTLVAKLSFAAPLSQMLAFAPFSVGGGAVSGPTGTRDSVYFDVIGSAFGFYAMQSVTTPPGGSGSTASAAFTPLDPGGPVGWGSLGDACVLTMQSSGTSGPCVLAEVTGAACLPYPAYCEGGACAQKLGSVHLLLDVLSIIAN